MPIQCVLIDDEPLALQVLQQYLHQFPELELLKSFTDPIIAKAFLQNHPVDLLFIDINMPDLKGTTLVKELREKPMVIFTTAYSNYAVEGFELDAIDYLVKPIELARFSKAVQKAQELYRLKNNQPETGSLHVRAGYQLLKINLPEIEYIESVEDYIRIYTQNNRPVMTLMTMKAVLDKLPLKQFVRIHRSYIVPVAKIKSFLNRKITLQSGTELPVSNSFVDVIKTLLK